jgi:hypothetical protein
MRPKPVEFARLGEVLAVRFQAVRCARSISGRRLIAKRDFGWRIPGWNSRLKFPCSEIGR